MNIDFWLHQLSQHPLWLPLAVGIVAFLESLAFVGLVLPGVAMLFALSALAGSVDSNLWLLLTGAFIGAAGGDMLSFLLGQVAAPRMVHRWPLSKHPEWVVQGVDFFHRHGAVSIVLGRFVGPIRPIIPFVAGSCGMSQSRFLLFNLSSALAWAPAYLLPGYLAGKSRQLLPMLEGTPFVALVTLITLLLIFQQIHFRLHPHAGLWHWLQRHIRPDLAGISMLMAASGLSLLLLIVLQLGGWAEAGNAALFDTLRSLGRQMPTTSAFLTHLGDPTLMASLATLCVLLSQFRYRSRSGWGVLIGTLSVLLLNVLLKESFQVPRPPEGAALYNSYSFPSGHASAASAFYALFTIWLLQGRSHRTRHAGYLIGMIPLILIPLSRPMLGVHWPLDIAAGAAEGVFIATFYRLWLFRDQTETPIPLGLPLLVVLGTAALYATVRILI